MPAQNLIAAHFTESINTIEASAAALGDIATQVGDALVAALRSGNKVLSFGNGGSATQASHLAGELIGRYKDTRRPYPAIALGSDPGSVTCISNDFGYGALYERQVEALVQPGDIVLGLTTSGTSENVVRGLSAAAEKGGVTVALTGAKGLVGADAAYVVAVPSQVTAHIQEVHLMLIHAWCAYIDLKMS